MKGRSERQWDSGIQGALPQREIFQHFLPPRAVPGGHPSWHRGAGLPGETADRVWGLVPKVVQKHLCKEGRELGSGWEGVGLTLRPTRTWLPTVQVLSTYLHQPMAAKACGHVCMHTHAQAHTHCSSSRHMCAQAHTGMHTLQLTPLHTCAQVHTRACTCCSSPHSTRVHKCTQAHTHCSSPHPTRVH